MREFRLLIAACIVGVMSLPVLAEEAGGADTPADAPVAPIESLELGDAAPAIVVSKWVKGEPVEDVTADAVTVVEFWATWCGPCIRTIPHLTELAADYADEGVRFVGVSVWERDASKVEPFVEKMGDKMVYSIAMDLVPEGENGSNGKMAKSWMDAAGENGIPSAFIVDKGGAIAWIGSPFDIDEPLAQIVAGDWDLEAAVAHRELEVARREADEANMKVMAALNEKISSAVGLGDFDEAVKIVDEALKANPEAQTMLSMARFNLLLAGDRFEEAYAYAGTLVDGACANDPAALNALAWTIVDPENVMLDERDYELAAKAAQKAVDLTKGEDPSILDTLGVALFGLKKYDEAIAVQTKAVELAKGTPMFEELNDRLDAFKAAASEGEEPSDSPAEEEAPAEEGDEEDSSDDSDE